MNKKRVLILSLMVLPIIGSIIAYATWYNTNVGSLEVTSPQTEVSYSINQKTFVGYQLIKNIRVGHYTVTAKGNPEENFVSKSYQVNIKRGENTKIYIWLDYTKENPDFSGVEPDDPSLY